jgi:hypothetical protein
MPDSPVGFRSPFSQFITANPYNELILSCRPGKNNLIRQIHAVSLFAQTCPAGIVIFWQF